MRTENSFYANLFAGNALAIIFTLVYLAIIVLMAVAMWKIYVKADKPGWACIVPFYSQYCLCDITFGNGWLFLLSFVPCVNYVMAVIIFFKLAKAFGQGIGFGFGLLFLSPIFLPILGFGSSEYVGPQ